MVKVMCVIRNLAAHAVGVSTFRGFDATTAVSTRLTALIEVFGVGTTRIFALIEP